jgi:hypothetical protein
MSTPGDGISSPGSPADVPQLHVDAGKEDADAPHHVGNRLIVRPGPGNRGRAHVTLDLVICMHGGECWWRQRRRN